MGRVGRLAVLIVAATVCVGCTSRNDPYAALARANASNIKRLANLYIIYQSKHDWFGPPSEEAFRDFIRSYNPKKLERIGVDPSATDDLFISERDGQPFTVLYGVRGSSRGSSDAVVFETVGVEGRRMVAYLDNYQEELDGAQCDALLNAR